MRNENWYDGLVSRDSFQASSVLPALMRKVFVWMTLGLVITALTAYGVASSPALLTLIFSSKLTFFGLIIAEVALVMWMSVAVSRMSLTTATLCFALFSAVNGATLASVFIVYSMTIITKVFLITAGTFGAMALVGFTTKTDLSFIGRYVIMALLGLIIATVVNIFIGSAGMDMLISYAGVIIFVGLTAYDTQRIKQMCLEAPDAGENMQKLALLGALELYLDFINLFLYLLRIFGNKRN